MNESSLWIVLQKMRLPFVVILITYTIAMTGLIMIPGEDLNGNVHYMSIFDAFYFVTYTATTIGYGELPFPFTYNQKIWVSVSIYLVVLGWFYSIGTLISLLQNKIFISEIAIAKFQRAVRHIEEDFVIVLGYNETTRKIIRRLLNAKMRVVVIEMQQERAEYLQLEGFIPNVPILVKDAHNPIALENAGIKRRNCKGIISIFEDNALNLRITLSSKLLNPHVNVIVKSTTNEETENLIDAGADIVDNPFSIIADQLQMSLTAPSLFKLENWLYQRDTLESKTFSIPNTNIIICGYGRLGASITAMFMKNGIHPTVIESIDSRVKSANYAGVKNIIHGNADDHYYLDTANVAEAELIIIATENDTTNLSILSTVKKVNQKALIVARENEITDFSIFSQAKIDHLYIPERILIQKTTNSLSNPLSDTLIGILPAKDEAWGQDLLVELIQKIGVDPLAYELCITKDDAYEIHKYLKEDENSIQLETLKLSRRDRTQKNNVVVLLILRDKEEILLPSDDIQLQIDDKILFACDENAIDDIEHIVNNAYEFQYIISGKEKKLFRL
ncbi:MAG: voltage-gated potassium channel [Sulfurimonas sp.]|jgi:voltage-gated potassium channel|uniref:potassium channel family protein n=1 Tax=Sulfurimonas sp. TaxID=2022749 RepID=UPI0039E448B2